jgi:hypothetical protein
MPDRSSKTPPRRGTDGEQWSRDVTADPDPYGGKNPAAVELGRLGGLKGGKARAAKLTSEERIRIARRAAEARWKAHRK